MLASIPANRQNESSMSTAPQQPTYIIPSPAPANWKTPLLIGFLVLLAASNIFLYVQLEHARTEGRTEMAKLKSKYKNAAKSVGGCPDLKNVLMLAMTVNPVDHPAA